MTMTNSVDAERRRLRERLAHLNTERTRLEIERGQVVFALGVLDRIAPEVTASGSGSSSRAAEPAPDVDVDVEIVSTRAGDGGVDFVGRTPSGDKLIGQVKRWAKARPGGSLDHILRIITASNRSWRAEDLVPEMVEQGWDAGGVENAVEAVRAALSRATREGLIERVGHGLYARPGRHIEVQIDDTLQLTDAAQVSATNESRLLTEAEAVDVMRRSLGAPVREINVPEPADSQ
jgi:Transcriptional regulator, AbiEi antitoxin